MNQSFKNGPEVWTICVPVVLTLTSLYDSSERMVMWHQCYKIVSYADKLVRSVHWPCLSRKARKSRIRVWFHRERIGQISSVCDWNALITTKGPFHEKQTGLPLRFRNSLFKSLIRIHFTIFNFSPQSTVLITQALQLSCFSLVYSS